MNTNPSAINVLCYGDSNTNGVKPDRSGRFAANERWTGLLQQQLGDDYYVVEEGLGGRATDLDHFNPDKPSRNGFTYFKACLDSHLPLHVIVIMLGTNDLKTAFNRSADEVAQALKQYPEYITKRFDSLPMELPRIILVSPAHIDVNAAKFKENLPTPGIYDETSAQKSVQLAHSIRRMAQAMNCEFFDAASVTQTGDDGIHIDLQSHKNLADSLYQRVVNPAE